MTSPNPRARATLPLIASCGAALVLSLLPTATVSGQTRGTVPPRSHQQGIEILYSGEYRRALRGFRSDLRGAIKTAQSRWIDSICSHAMLGETFYQQGLNAEALNEFDQACQLFLAYPDWLSSVDFRQPPRADRQPARRIPPWGPSARQVTYVTLSDTQLVRQGRVDNSQQAEQGGIVQLAQYWRVDAAEIVRCTTLAIRRRNELLGPLAKTDRLSKELVDALSRGSLGLGNHWSNAWLELQLGVAQAGIGKDKQAIEHLSRATLIDGRFDHSLTGAALLAQAEIANLAGNSREAAALYREASIAAFAYGDLDILSESLSRGHAHHLTNGGQGTFSPLKAALAWADRQNFDHVDWLARHALAESLLLARQTDQAAALLNAASTRRRDLNAGRIGVERQKLSALVAMQQANHEEGRAALLEAVNRQAAVSLSNFQTGLASARFDTGALSPRLAVGVYPQLLSDPSPEVWAREPLDAIAHMLTNHDAALDRWFAASINRDEKANALLVSDLAKRRRFFRTQPLGGRLIALRRLLETVPENLDKVERLQRQAILASIPYQSLAEQALAARAALVALEQPFEEGRPAADAAKLLSTTARLAAERENLLWEAALLRLTTTFGFPRLQTLPELKERMDEGDAVVVFHRSGGAMHGFVVVAGGEHHWRLPGSIPEISAQIGATLRDFGNFNPSRALPSEAARSDEWRESAHALGQLLLGESRLDIANIKRLVIVPEGPIWHVPLDAVLLSSNTTAPTLQEAAPLRYVPTFGLAFGDFRPARPVIRTGLALNRPSGSPLEREVAEDEARRLESALGAVVRLASPAATPSPLLAGTVDQLVVELETDLDPAAPLDWTPAPLDRNRGRGRLSRWLTLPGASPLRMVLGGVHTLAENGLKSGRRSSPRNAGDELFHAACGLLGSGPRTVLMTRWQTGGAVHAELVREFASQMDKLPAEQAWRRSVALTRDTIVDPAVEPRLEWKETEGDPPHAKHPFFWSGYLLLDTGSSPRGQQPKPTPELQ